MVPNLDLGGSRLWFFAILFRRRCNYLSRSLLIDAGKIDAIFGLSDPRINLHYPFNFVLLDFLSFRRVCVWGCVGVCVCV